MTPCLSHHISKSLKKARLSTLQPSGGRGGGPPNEMSEEARGPEQRVRLLPFPPLQGLHPLLDEDGLERPVARGRAGGELGVSLHGQDVRAYGHAVVWAALVHPEHAGAWVCSGGCEVRMWRMDT
jgi:hypothetical protein